VLDGPIDASQKFTIFYSTSKNPERDYLNDQLTLGGFIPITNPDNAEAATWLTEDQVTDWNQIHSFQIKLNEDETLTVNEEFVFEFTTVVDSEDVAIFNELVKSYVAWNSFALTIDGYPIIEPLQVAVRIEHEFIDYTVNKVWVNGPETKPAIQVQLLRDSEAQGDPVTLDGSENWTYTWTDLPKTDVSGNEYEYSIEEVNVPEGYEVSIDGNMITNTFIVEETEYTVNKVWVNGPETKPAIQVQLLRNGEAYGNPVTLDGTENWTYTWTELPKTDSAENEYVYSVKEVNVPEGYEESIDGNTITNTYIPPVEPPVDPPKPDTSELPSTGDSSTNMMVAWTFLLSGIVLLLVSRKKKIGINEEKFK
jgi:LPXTG-motif cell wall-anchored protein